jgi:hypothetical protein
VDVSLVSTVTPFGDVPDRRRGICKDGLEEGPFSVAEGFPQGATKLEMTVTCRACQSNGGLAALLVPPWVFPI